MLISLETMASPSGSKPMPTFCAADRLRVSSPAATSRTIVTAICVTTRPSRSVQRRTPTRAPATSLFSSVTRFGRVAFSAGASPATSAASMATPAVNSSTRLSILSANDTGIGIGSEIDIAACVSAHASTTPAAAPRTAMTRLSDSSCCTSRRRLAPIARLMPISFWRPDAQASSKLATFAHAISRTSPTTNISANAIGRSVRSAIG